MAERYISSEWMLKTLEEYKNIKMWKTSKCGTQMSAMLIQSCGCCK